MGAGLPRVDWGAESNCAIGLARLGHSVCWVSRLGRDPFGSRVLKTLRGEGVDVSRVDICDRVRGWRTMPLEWFSGAIFAILVESYQDYGGGNGCFIRMPLERNWRKTPQGEIVS
jgi:hypothetical protein